MPTYTFSGYKVLYNNNDEPIDIDPSTFSVVFNDGDTPSEPYTILGQEPGNLPEVDFAGGNSRDAILDGASFNQTDPFSGANDETLLGEVTWNDGSVKSAVVIIFYDDASNTDYLFQLDGDPVPNFQNAIQFFDFTNLITNTAPATGVWAPGDPGIDLSNSSFSSFSDADNIFDNDECNLIETGAGNDTVIGNGGDDTIRAGDGNDSITGDDGDDRLEGGDGNDTLDASGGDVSTQGNGDYIRPGLGANTIIGHAAHYSTDEGIDLSYGDISGHGGILITSGANGTGTVTGAGGQINDTFSYVHYFEGTRDGNDTIIGSNDDQFEGFAGLGGADSIVGGGGYNLLDYSYEADYFGGVGTAINANLNTGIIADTQGNNDTVSGIDEVRGTDLNDTMTAAGSSESIRFRGEAGNDTITAGLGNDTLQGGDGNDLINPGDNSDYDEVSAGAGQDTITFASLSNGFVGLRHDDLTAGVTFSVNGNANTGSIDKGINGTTTLVDVENPILSGAVNGGLGLTGTVFDDGFNITSHDNGWMQIIGGAGSDSYTIGASQGTIRLDFRDNSATQGLNINLATGAIANDGFGNSETISGPGRVQEIRATREDDMIVGSNENDRFILMQGADTVDGQGGDDTVRYDRSGVSAVNVDLTAGSASGNWDGTGFSHSLINIENIRGSRNDDDTLRGSSADNLIEGRGGDDTIIGEGGNDTLLGEDGNDSITGGIGNDSVQAGNGNDDVSGGVGADTLFGNGNDDTLAGNEGADQIFGGSGDDSMAGGASTDILNGGTGADSMDGNDGSDTFFVDGGDTVTDTGAFGYDKVQINDAAGVSLNLSGWSGVERLNGFTGNDVINAASQSTNVLLFGAAGNDNLIGGTGNDLLLGDAGNDTLAGGGGNDTIQGGSGDDSMTGGAGNDLFIIGEAGDVVSDGGDGFDKAAINATGGINLNVSTWSSVERIVGYLGDDTLNASGQSDTMILVGANGADLLIGGSAGDILLGSSGNDTISGGGGNDTIQGGTGNDEMSGGDGNDSFFVGESGDVVTDGGAGFDKAVINDAGGLSINVGSWANVERINGFTGSDNINGSGLVTSITMAGAGGNDTLIGGSSGDTFYGGGDADDISGNGGADALIGGSGNDSLDGGTGNDFLLGQLGVDSFVFDDGFGIDVIQDYVDETDRLDFAAHSGVNSLADLDINQAGGNAVITLTAGGSDRITLVGVTATDLEASDFDFV